MNIILVLMTLASLCGSFQRLFSIAASKFGACGYRCETAKLDQAVEQLPDVMRELDLIN